MYIADPLSNFLPGRIFLIWSPPEKKRGMGVGGVFLDVLWYTTCMSKRYKDMTSEERKVYDRDRHLRKKYGIGLDEYNLLREEQGYCCKICGRHESEIRPKKRARIKGRSPDPLVVDHCHETGDVRGLVCTKCNNGLGAFRDDPELLRKGILYLEEGRADSGG